MNRTIAIILLVAVGIYCFPTLLGIIASAVGIAVGMAGAIFGVGISLLFTLLPYVILAYVIWWLVHDKRSSKA